MIKAEDLRDLPRDFDQKKSYVVHNWKYGKFGRQTPFGEAFIEDLEAATVTHSYTFEHCADFEKRADDNQ
jgi:hypothetical protein